jgi:hypothetical protein
MRFTLSDVPAVGTPLEVPQQSMRVATAILALTFVIFAGVEWVAIRQFWGHSIRDVFDLTFALFEGFWVLGWTVGVVILGALTVLMFFFGESTHVDDAKLVYVPRLGPLKIVIERDLVQMRNLRLENDRSGNAVRIRFDDDEGTHGLGEAMPRSEGERLVGIIDRARVAAGALPFPVRARAPVPAPDARPDGAAPPVDLHGAGGSMSSLSVVALVAANLVPLGGVLFFGWDLATVMILYWAESAVIGFYTALKIAVVGKFGALFAVPFFVGHFGGFMALHFLFIYSFFVRGVSATGPAPAVRDALTAVFVPLWPSLAALFVSHGISFFSNFIRRREYVGATVSGLMTAPYNRIAIMQITIILGGWLILLLNSPVAALVVLVLIKTGVDLSAHRKEHR